MWDENQCKEKIICVYIYLYITVNHNHYVIVKYTVQIDILYLYRTLFHSLNSTYKIYFHGSFRIYSGYHGKEQPMSLNKQSNYQIHNINKDTYHYFKMSLSPPKDTWKKFFRAINSPFKLYFALYLISCSNSKVNTKKSKTRRSYHKYSSVIEIRIQGQHERTGLTRL